METTTAGEGTEQLSKLLYQGTTEAHQAAEQTPYMLALFEGKLTERQYRVWLARFHHVYAALEETAQALADDPVVGGVWVPELSRREAIERDLAHYYGSGWRSELQTSPATDRYVARLRRVRDEWPLGLIPHVWIRYAGYLHGGASLAGLLAKTYGLSGDTGTAFYRFDQIPDNREFITAFHARMNAVPTTGADRELLVAEGNHAFQGNTEITVELGSVTGVG